MISLTTSPGHPQTAFGDLLLPRTHATCEIIVTYNHMLRHAMSGSKSKQAIIYIAHDFSAVASGKVSASVHQTTPELIN